jgi:hypothetical protein
MKKIIIETFVFAFMFFGVIAMGLFLFRQPIGSSHLWSLTKNNLTGTYYLHSHEGRGNSQFVYYQDNNLDSIPDKKVFVSVWYPKAYKTFVELPCDEREKIAEIIQDFLPE